MEFIAKNTSPSASRRQSRQEPIRRRNRPVPARRRSRQERADRRNAARRNRQERTTDRRNRQGPTDRRSRYEESTIMEMLRQEERFSYLVEALEKNDNLRDDLDDDQESMTFFAPTNEAFERLREIMNPGEGNYKAPRIRDMPEIADILTYHMVNEEMEFKDFFDGQLLESRFRSEGLDDENQMIRVDKLFGSIHLNWMTRISEGDIKVGNGVVHVVDFVMLPPMNAYKKAFLLNFWFSTFTSAAQETGMKKEMESSTCTTILMPSNAAWKELHCNDLLYLFSPMGAKDLKKIVQYHICSELAYADCLIEDQETTLPTFLSDEEVTIEVVKRPQQSRSNNSNNESPNEYMFVINDGEASIKRTDLITKNGNIHEINAVLIPKSVVLPSMRNSEKW